MNAQQRLRMARTEARWAKRDERKAQRRNFVYRLHDAEGSVLYVGRSCNVAHRIRSHLADNPWATQVRSVTMFGPMTWAEVVRAERAEIARLQPPGNVALTVRDHRPAVAFRSAVPELNDVPRCPTCGTPQPGGDRG